MKLWRLGIAAKHSMSQGCINDLPVAGKDPIDVLVARSSFSWKFSSHTAINLDLVPLFLVVVYCSLPQVSTGSTAFPLLSVLLFP